MGNLLTRLKSGKRSGKSGKGVVTFASDDSVARAAPQPMPDVHELNAMFEAFIDDLNLQADKKEMMRAFPNERKWMMLQALTKEKDRGIRNNTENDYEQIVQALKDGPSTELLSSLSVSLRARPIRWIAKFVEIQGLTSLLAYLKSMEESKMQYEHEELCIKCLKSLMNNKHGLQSVMDHPESLMVTALSLRSPFLRTRALVLEILGAVCLIPNGHRRILDAMTNFAKVTGERARFDTVVNCLTMDISVKAGGWVGNVRVTQEEKVERILDLKIAALSFINAIICGGPGRDLEFRAYLRNEFGRLGVNQVVERLSKAAYGLLETQIHVYQERMKSDEDEISARYDTEKLNLDDPEAIFNSIYNRAQNTQTFLPFLATMQTLLLIPSHPLRRPKYWTLFNEIAKQIIIQKDNIDVDPSTARISINVQSLITELVDAEKLKESEDKARKQTEKANKAIKDLETVKLAHEEDIKKYEEKLNSKSKREDELVDDLTTAKADIARLEKALQMAQKTATAAIAGSSVLGTPVAGSPLRRKSISRRNSTKMVLSLSLPDISDDAPAENLKSPASAGRRLPPPPPPPPPAPGNLVDSGMPQPPGPLPSGLRPKRNKLSSKALRPYQWSKLTNNEIVDTVWKELDDEPLHRRINYNEVEVLFAALQKPEPTTEVIVHASSGSIAADSGVAKVTVLAGKRAQMCNIFLKFLKVTAEELKRAIFAMDTRVFSPHILMELMKLVPTNDEIQMLQQFENDVDNMAAAERFFWQVSQIHRYGERIRALYVRGMFDEWIDDAKNMVKSWMVGCRDVRDSKKFLEMLQTVLALGNYLNSGNRGGAYGFRLESLTKLSDVKSTLTVRKYTLLNHLAEVCENQVRNAKGWTSEVKSAAFAAKVELPVLRQTMSAIQSGLQDVSTLLTHIAADPKQPDDRFPRVLGDWAINAQKKFDLLDSAFKDAQTMYAEVCLRFGEDARSTTIGEFFGRIWQFAQQYEAAVAENEAFVLRVQEMEKKDREKLFTRRPHGDSDPNATTSSRPLSLSPTSPTQNEGELDDIISAIKSGKAFFQQGFQPQKRVKPGAPSDDQAKVANEQGSTLSSSGGIAAAKSSNKTADDSSSSSVRAPKGKPTPQEDVRISENRV